MAVTLYRVLVPSGDGPDYALWFTSKTDAQAEVRELLDEDMDVMMQRIVVPTTNSARLAAFLDRFAGRDIEEPVATPAPKTRARQP